MIKSELVQRIADRNPHLYLRDVENIVNAIRSVPTLTYAAAAQVVDAAMTDGTAMLSAMMYGMRARGIWSTQRGENLLDGGAHFYDTYACADGKYVAIGAIEGYGERLALGGHGLMAVVRLRGEALAGDRQPGVVVERGDPGHCLGGVVDHVGEQVLGGGDRQQCEREPGGATEAAKQASRTSTLTASWSG